mgnify:FL=1
MNSPHKEKRYLKILTAVACVSLLSGSLVYFALKDQSLHYSSEIKQTAKVQYALVNEDKGARFENTDYNLGSDFVTLINQDTENNWETTNRSVAEAGLKSGQFDAVITLPSDFSEKLLSLESVSPEKATVSYQIREGQNEQANQAVHSQVNTVLQGFNQRVVRMYFSSIIRNLSDAQTNVNQMATTELSQNTFIISNIQAPFSTLPDSFRSTQSIANSLKTDNELFKTQQEAFVKSVASSMEANNNSLDASGKALESTTNSVNEFSKEANTRLEKSTNQYKEQSEKDKAALEKQWTDDQKHYSDLYNALYTVGNAKLKELQLSDTATGSFMADFKAKAGEYKTAQSKVKGNLEAQITSLEKEVAELRALRETIAETYYGSKDLSDQTATDKDIRSAILNLMTKPENRSKLPKQYIEAIASRLPMISSGDLSALIAKLEQDKLISSDEATTYRNALKIVSNYSSELGDSLGQNTTFKYLSSAATVTSPVTYPIHQTLEFDPSTGSQTVQLNIDDANMGNLELEGVTKDSIEASIRQQLKDTGYHVTAAVSGNTIQVTFVNERTASTTPVASSDSGGSSTSNADASDAATSTNSTSTSESTTATPTTSPKVSQPSYATLPKKVSVTISGQIKWNLSDDVKKNSYNQVGYSWTDGSSVQASAQLSVFNGKYDTLAEDLPAILKNFQNLDLTAQQIVTLFASPGASLDINQFASTLSSGTLVQKASPDSVYSLYNNLTDDERASEISDVLVTKYRLAGDNLYKQVDQQLKDVTDILGEKENPKEGTLRQVYQSLPDSDLLVKQASALNTWYGEMQKVLDEAHNQWKDSEKLAYESVVNDQNPQPEKMNTSKLEEEVKSLLSQYDSLRDSSKKTAQATADGAAQVRDISPQIQQLNETTESIQKSADGVLSSLNQSVKETSGTVEKNTSYAEQFGKVLANAKSGGSDNKQVFNFLSDPITTKVTEGKTQAASHISIIPYYMTLLLSVISFVIAMTIGRFVKDRQEREETDLLTTKKWDLKLQSFLPTIITATVGSILFSGVTIGVATAANGFLWFIYSFMLMASLILVLSYSLKKAPYPTYIVSASLLGFYLLLTPILGVATQSGSFLNFLYRLSPLQNIENGFSYLLVGGNLSIVTILLLLLFVGIGVSLNLFTRKK